MLSCTKDHPLIGEWLKFDFSHDLSGFFTAAVTMLVIAMPSKMVYGQPLNQSPNSAGFSLVGYWPTGEWFQKHMKIQLIQNSKIVTTDTQDPWGKPECCSCDWRSMCWFSSFYCLVKCSFPPLLWNIEPFGWHSLRFWHIYFFFFYLCS